MSRRRKVIIDTDPGIDDALAIFLALASPEIDVVGLTSVFGNAEIDVTTRGALALLEIAGRTDIPVAAGAEKPLAGPYLGAVPHIHGADGQGDSNLAMPKAKPVDTPAADFIVETITKSPGEITLLALGPLTNLALALKKSPAIAQKVAQVVIMGGNATVPGNATPEAEANIFNDPEAADIVFGTPWPLAMIGLDVTHQVTLTDAMVETIGASPKETGRHVARIMPVYRRFNEEAHHLDGVYLHDPSAVAYLIDPALFGTSAWPVRVELEGSRRGKTEPWLGGDATRPSAWQGRPAVDVCTEVDAGRLIAMVVERLS